jgi:uncharacterized protein
METPLFFRNSAYKLFGVMHTPDNHNSPPSSKGIGIVFCHPFSEEKLISYRAMVNLARSLTTYGISCLRFDEMGHGDSDGNFEDSTIETRLSDIRCAIKFIKEKTVNARIGFVGVRLGATLSALASTQELEIDFLVMIAPIIDGKPYIEQCLRSNLTTQMTTYGNILKDRTQLVKDLMSGQLVNIDGYLISRELYMQMGKINLLNDIVPSARHILLIQISPKENMPFEKGIQQIHAKYKTHHSDVELMNVQEDHFWKDGKVYSPRKINLQNTVTSWLKNRYL